jgi:hypothetical protein
MILRLWAETPGAPVQKLKIIWTVLDWRLDW